MAGQARALNWMKYEQTIEVNIDIEVNDINDIGTGD